MRDIALVAMIFGCVPVILRYPFAGVLVWAWISIAVPHQEAWGFSNSIPLNLIVAGATIAGWMFSKDRQLPPTHFIYWTFIVFLVWVTFNSFFALAPSWSWEFWDRCWKTIVLGLFAAAMATNKVRLHALIWVVVISLFYYGVKGGIFTLTTGGQYHVLGPPNSFIGDNNCLALALLMVLPLANYLRLQTRRKWLATGTLIAMGFTVIAIIGSYSRGAMLGLAAVCLAGLFRTKHRFLYLALVTVLVVPVFQFMPASFHERIQSISQAETDESFQGRVSAWKVAYYCARDYFPLGVGFYGPQRNAVYHTYLPGEEAHAAHSIYFQVLGEHGFIGLGIYLVLIAAAFVTSTRIRKLTRGVPGLEWNYQLASMIQVSLIAFCVGGAALSLAYYDVFILNVALLLPLLKIAHATVAARRAVKPVVDDLPGALPATA
ncbi:MAG TPA: putative O-glycosylation ligase, exosortase A system-associated [Rhizomicrobium sp.]|nr:putative O-glycosylation ligase, exosortase A system-associated [Rhizomicrobium sp.]